jgi:acetate kinase
VFDAIAVLNAGSASLKFSLFAERGNALELTGDQGS